MIPSTGLSASSPTTPISLGSGATFTEPTSPGSIATGPTSPSHTSSPVASLSPTLTFIDSFQLKSPRAGPRRIVAAPDNSIWFDEFGTPSVVSVTARIGTITPSHVLQEWDMSPATPTAIGPFNMVVGPDRNIWFAEFGNENHGIGRVLTSGQVGQITVFPTPAGERAVGITVGPDNNLWFGEFGNASPGLLGIMTTNGQASYHDPQWDPTVSRDPWAIVKAPDGSVWVTEYTSNKIQKLTSAGDLAAQFSIPSTASDGTTSRPAQIVVGPDYNLWFTESQANKIGKITPQGIITEYPLPTPNSYPDDIALGRDGNLWFTESQGPRIGEISADGHFKEFAVPSGDDDPEGITFDQAGNLWFTAFMGNRIVEATIG